MDQTLLLDHKVLFADVQALSRLKRVLHTALAALQGQLRILQCLAQHHETLIEVSVKCDAANTISLLRVEIEHFQEAFNRSLRKADEYRTLVRKIAYQRAKVRN